MIRHLLNLFGILSLAYICIVTGITIVVSDVLVSTPPQKGYDLLRASAYLLAAMVWVSCAVCYVYHHMTRPIDDTECWPEDTEDLNK